MTFMQKLTTLARRHWLLFSAIIGVVILRAVLLTFTPPGFYLDEAASGAHVISMLAHGTNAHGETWPLFSASLGGGYTTPIYLYPLTVWAFIFGVSEYSLRAFSLAATIMTAALIAWTIRIWQNNKAALIASLITLILPWGWVQGSIAWDTAIVPLFVAAALFGLTVALKSRSPKRRLLATIATGLSLICLAYLYPPCRVTAPLLLALYFSILLHLKKISVKTLLILIPIFALLCIPLLQFMLEPEALERSSKLSVFHDVGLIEGLWRMLLNFLLILNPFFLFVAGDTNLRHATGPQGMLGLAALPAIGTLLYFSLIQLRHYQQTRKWKQTPTSWLVLLATSGILLSVLGSALTIEGQPHALRATAAWPFFVILITIGWVQLLNRLKQPFKILLISFAVVATGWYIIDLAVYYPERSASSFDVPIRQMLKTNQPTPDYPPLSLFYYNHK
jgi:4-amino-4-deoxy-L-arabinose transferase-like glycosyltransferase